MELSNGSRLSVSGVGHFKLSQNVLRHVVLGDRLNDEVHVAHRAFVWPVLVAHVASHLIALGQHHDDVRVVLENHAPEVVHRVRQWSLRCDVVLCVDENGKSIVNSMVKWLFVCTENESIKTLLPSCNDNRR